MNLKLLLILLLATLQTSAQGINSFNPNMLGTTLAQASIFKDFQLSPNLYNPEDTQEIAILYLGYTNAETLAQLLYTTSGKNNDAQDDERLDINEISHVRIMVNQNMNAIILIGPETYISTAASCIAKDIDAPRVHENSYEHSTGRSVILTIRKTCT